MKLSKMARALASAKRNSQRLREKAGQSASVMMESLEVGGSAFAIGVAQAYTGKTEIMGVPVGLGIGIACNLAAIMGAGGHENHLKNIGNGALAGYGAALGLQVGAQMKKPGAAVKVSGQDPVAELLSGGQGYEYEMAGPVVIEGEEEYEYAEAY